MQFIERSIHSYYYTRNRYKRLKTNECACEKVSKISLEKLILTVNNEVSKFYIIKYKWMSYVKIQMIRCNVRMIPVNKESVNKRVIENCDCMKIAIFILFVN